MSVMAMFHHWTLLLVTDVWGHIFIQHTRALGISWRHSNRDRLVGNSLSAFLRSSLAWELPDERKSINATLLSFGFVIVTEPHLVSGNRLGPSLHHRDDLAFIES